MAKRSTQHHSMIPVRMPVREKLDEAMKTREGKLIDLVSEIIDQHFSLEEVIDEASDTYSVVFSPDEKLNVRIRNPKEFDPCADEFFIIDASSYNSLVCLGTHSDGPLMFSNKEAAEKYSKEKGLYMRSVSRDGVDGVLSSYTVAEMNGPVPTGGCMSSEYLKTVPSSV
mgnify:CR=1 FL=1